MTVRAVEDLNPWGFVIKSLDFIDLKCYQQSGKLKGLPNEDECKKFQKLRKDFEFLFIEVIKKMDANLTIISKDWDRNTMKTFPDKDKGDLSGVNRKYIKETALKLASISINDTMQGKKLSRKLQSAFALNFGMYVGYKMNDFLKKVWDPIILELWNNLGVQLDDSCMKEEETCMPHLRKAYKDLYLPFFIMRIPIETLGFGQFLSYFSRLITKNTYGKFIESGSKVSSEEKIIEKYLVDVFDNIVPEEAHSLNISVFEAVKVLHFSARVTNNKFSYANFLMKKFGCGGSTGQRMLNQAWLDWVDEENNAVGAQKGSLKSFLPCSNITEAEAEGYYVCCKPTVQMQDKLKPILKIMKYASQPPHFTESSLETNLTFEDVDFLKYPLALPLRSTNSNPKIPICQYSGKPTEPMIVNCNLFSRSITNEGLGHTFNGPNFWAMYSETQYTKLFSDIMFPKNGHDLRKDYIKDGLIDPYVDANIRFPETSGPSYGLSIVLDSIHLYSSSGENITFKAVKTPFKVNPIVSSSK